MGLVPGKRPFCAWSEAFYALYMYINCMIRILNNFSYIDNKFIVEAFKAWHWAFSDWKETILCPERVFL